MHILFILKYIKLDPYVEVIYKDETLKTEVIKNNQSPVWNKEFTIEGAKLKAEPIKFNMTDWDRFTSIYIISNTYIHTYIYTIQYKNIYFRG